MQTWDSSAGNTSTLINIRMKIWEVLFEAPHRKALPIKQKINFAGLVFVTRDQQQYYYPGKNELGDMWRVFLPPNGDVIGGFTFDPLGRDDAVSIHISVKPEFRRQGYATKMYQFAKEIARQQGKELIPSPHQTPAVKALWKKGF